MASKSSTMINPALFEDQDHQSSTHSQMGFFSFPQNLPFQVPSLGFNNQSLRAISSCLTPSSQPFFDAPNNNNNNFSSINLPETLLSSVLPLKLRDHEKENPSEFGGQELLSLQKSSSTTANLWPWGEVGESLNTGKRNNDYHHLGVSAMRMKKMKGRRKVREPRFSFKTMTDVDVLDDGYKWRKYGQKVVKNTQHPRSYYRCTQDHCRVKKRVERLAEDPRMVITTYEGRHIHSPSHDSEDSEAQTHLNNFFW